MEKTAEDINDHDPAELRGKQVIGNAQGSGRDQRRDDQHEHAEGRRLPDIGKSDQRKHDQADRDDCQITDRCVIGGVEMRIGLDHRHHPEKRL